MKKIMLGIIFFFISGFICTAAESGGTVSGNKYVINGGTYASGSNYFRNTYEIVLEPGVKVQPFIYFRFKSDENAYTGGGNMGGGPSISAYIGYAIVSGENMVAGKLFSGDANVKYINNTRYKISDDDVENLGTIGLDSNNNLIYVASGGIEGNVPIFGYLPFENDDDFSEESLQKLADYFVNGNSNNLLNPGFGDYPVPDEELNIKYDEQLGFLRNCRIDIQDDDSYEIAGSGTGQGDLAPILYKITWEYVPSSGAAAEVDKDNGFSMGDLINAADSVRVQMRVDISRPEGSSFISSFRYIRYEGVDIFEKYSDMPNSMQEEYILDESDLIERVNNYALKYPGKSDGFSIKNQVFYFRLIRYSSKDGLYHTSKAWVRIIVPNDGGNNIIDSGYFDENGNFVVDNDSEGSYSMVTDHHGNVIGGNKVPDEFLTSDEKLNLREEDGWNIIDNFIDSMKSFPAFMTKIFGFLPESLRWAVGAVFLTIVSLSVIALVVKIFT